MDSISCSRRRGPTAMVPFRVASTLSVGEEGGCAGADWGGDDDRVYALERLLAHPHKW